MNPDACINCMYNNNRISKKENGLALTWCRKHNQYVAPIDTCENYKNKEGKKNSKLFADIVFKDESGIEIAHITKEEDTQYVGLDGTIHKFFFEHNVYVSDDLIDVIKGEEKMTRRMSDLEKINNLIMVLKSKHLIDNIDVDFINGNISESEWIESKEEDS